MRSLIFQFSWQTKPQWWKYAKYTGAGLVLVFIFGGMLIGNMVKTDGIIAEFRTFRDVMNTTTPSTTTTTRNTKVEDALTKIAENSKKLTDIAENSNKIFQAIDNLNPAQIHLGIIDQSSKCIHTIIKYGLPYDRLSLNNSKEIVKSISFELTTPSEI